MFHEVQNIVKIEIQVFGRVTQSDIIGAVFGQTEDVLGEHLELRHLQKTHQIGRIDVETEFDGEKTIGMITIPSHMDRSLTVIIAAALETITKIGPCRAAARVNEIENIKSIKIREIIDHAKKLLEKFMSISIASQELIDEVVNDVRISRETKYGKEGREVPCGPEVEQFDEIIFVETVPELHNLLKSGINNVVAFEDCSKIETLKELAEKHSVIIFINKGREYLVRKICEFADADSFTKPDVDKPIVQLESKEIFKAIRNIIACEQMVGKKVSFTTSSSEAAPMPIPMSASMQSQRLEVPQNDSSQSQYTEERREFRPRPQFQQKQFNDRPFNDRFRNEHRTTERFEPRQNSQRFEGPRFDRNQNNQNRDQRPEPQRYESRNDRDTRLESPRYESRDNRMDNRINEEDQQLFKEKLAEVKGANHAIVIDNHRHILGKLPNEVITETVKSLSNVHSIIVDGKITKDLIFAAERAGVKFLVGSSAEGYSNRLKIITNLAV